MIKFIKIADKQNGKNMRIILSIENKKNTKKDDIYKNKLIISFN